MAKPLLPDKLWERISPLLPPEPPNPITGPGQGRWVFQGMGGQKE